MIDFENYNSTLKIPIVDYITGVAKTDKYVTLYEPVRLITQSGEPPDTIATVLNSGESTSRGKHWVAIFIDLRGLTWTLEYYNSSGRPPYEELHAWAAKNKVMLDKYIKNNNLPNTVEFIHVSNIQHQRSKSTCGKYSLYYIWSRLNGIEPGHFKHNVITDDVVQQFTQTHMYRDKDAN
jgi:hypothetical protein